MGESDTGVEFSVLEGRFCVAKLAVESEFPQQTKPSLFWSVSRDEDEVTIVTEESFSYPGAEIERGWKAIKIRGPLDFALKGVLVSVLNPLNAAGVSVFVMSTYSTDYIFVKNDQLAVTVAAMTASGHRQILS